MIVNYNWIYPHSLTVGKWVVYNRKRNVFKSTFGHSSEQATNNYELYYCTLKCSEFCAALASADASAVFLIKYKKT